MKKTLFSLVLSLILVACIPNQGSRVSTDTTSVAEEYVGNDYKVMNLVDSVFALYPKRYANEIQNKRFCTSLFNSVDAKLKEDNAYLSEIKMQLVAMRQKGSKYILKFECGEYTTDDWNLINEKKYYKVNYAIFAEVPEDLAAELEVNQFYYVFGTYMGSVDGKLELPSGNRFDYPPTCNAPGFGDTYASICLGGFLFKDINCKNKM